MTEFACSAALDAKHKSTKEDKTSFLISVNQLVNRFRWCESDI